MEKAVDSPILTSLNDDDLIDIYVKYWDALLNPYGKRSNPRLGSFEEQLGLLEDMFAAAEGVYEPAANSDIELDRESAVYYLRNYYKFKLGNTVKVDVSEFDEFKASSKKFIQIRIDYIEAKLREFENRISKGLIPFKVGLKIREHIFKLERSLNPLYGAMEALSYGKVIIRGREDSDRVWNVENWTKYQVYYQRFKRIAGSNAELDGFIYFVTLNLTNDLKQDIDQLHEDLDKLWFR